MDKNEFELAYRRAQEDGGHSYDQWDIAYAWKQYQTSPEKYDWILPFRSN